MSEQVGEVVSEVAVHVVPFGEDEYEVMGGLLEEPLPVTMAKTVDVLVPAYAEVVIEGRILPHERIGEGPYGEFTWY